MTDASPVPVPSPTPTGTSAWLVPRTLLNLFLAGLMLRLLLLGYWALSMDEGVVWFSAQGPWGPDPLVTEAGHPPLWNLVTRLWLHAFGESTAMVRTPAVLLGIASMWFAWLLGLRLFVADHVPRRGRFAGLADAREGRRRAVWFAGLVAMSVAFVETSQEAAPFAALIAASLGLSLLYLRWLDRDDRLSLVVYGISAVLALYTHAAGLWIVVAHAAHAVWVRGHSGPDEPVLHLRRFLLTAGAVLLAFVPWIVNRTTVAHAVTTTSQDQLHGLWRLAAGPGLEMWSTAWTVVLATVGVWALLLGFGLIPLCRRVGSSFVLSSLWVPVVGLANAHTLLPAFAEPRLVLLAPWLVLVALIGAFEAPRALRGLLLTALVLVTAAGTVSYTVASRDLAPEEKAWTLDGRTVHKRYVPDPDGPLAFLGRGHAYDRAPWLEIHDFIKGLAGPDDVVLLAPDRAQGAWQHVGLDPYGPTRADKPPFHTFRLSQVGDDTSSASELVSAARRVFLVRVDETSDHADAPFDAVLDYLVRRWRKPGGGLSVVGPVRFGSARVVRVMVFTRS